MSAEESAIVLGMEKNTLRWWLSVDIDDVDDVNDIDDVDDIDDTDDYALNALVLSLNAQWWNDSNPQQMSNIL